MEYEVMVNKSAPACCEILRGQLVSKILLSKAVHPHPLLPKNFIVTSAIATLHI